MPRTIAKTAILRVRLTEEELEKIRKAAAKDGRTVSGWVRHVIEDARWLEVVHED